MDFFSNYESDSWQSAGREVITWAHFGRLPFAAETYEPVIGGSKNATVAVAQATKKFCHRLVFPATDATRALKYQAIV